MVPVLASLQQHALIAEERRQNALNAALVRQTEWDARGGVRPHGGGRNSARRGGSLALGSRPLAPHEGATPIASWRVVDARGLQAPKTSAIAGVIADSFFWTATLVQGRSAETLCVKGKHDG